MTQQRSWLYWVGGVLALVALVLLIGWLGFGWFKTSSAPAEPTPEVRVVEQTRVVVVEWTATPGAPAVPVNTPIPAVPTCTSSATVKSETPFDVNSNMDTGDGAGWVVTYGYDDTGSRFVAIIEIGWNLDFESTRIRGKYWLLDGDVVSVTCFAKNIAATAGVSNFLYVGSDDAPVGFAKEVVRGWKMTMTQPFTEVKVDTGAAAWSDSMNRNKKDTAAMGDQTGVIYAQLWDGVDSSKVLHLIVAMGYEVKFTGLQGTLWKVTGGDAVSVQDRFDQMSREVELRDDQPVVIKLYCGSSTPTGWSASLPNGWSCDRIP